MLNHPFPESGSHRQQAIPLHALHARWLTLVLALALSHPQRTQEEYVMDVVGALEHDPELNGPQPHRAFLNSSVAFKEVCVCVCLGVCVCV